MANHYLDRDGLEYYHRGLLNIIAESGGSDSPFVAGDGENSAVLDGGSNAAEGELSVAEGNNNVATGKASHAEGFHSSAIGWGSHTEGNDTYTLTYYSHAEGNHTSALGENSHSEGNYTYAQGDYSHAEGNNTVASDEAQHAGGKSNVESLGAVVIGNGTQDARSNAALLGWNGDLKLNGDVYVNCESDSTGGTKLMALPVFTEADNGKILGIVDGQLAWVEK